MKWNTKKPYQFALYIDGKQVEEYRYPKAAVNAAVKANLEGHKASVYDMATNETIYSFNPTQQ